MKSILATTLIFVLALASFPKNLCAQSDERLQRMRNINPSLPGPISIDEPLASRLGIQKRSGKHVTIFTDIKGREDLDELTRVFDLAVVAWCEYFDVDSTKADAWHLRGMVIGDQDKFRTAKLLPTDLPDFPAGFQRGHEMWVYLQPGRYYTRHLLIHEGTHSFMQWFLGGTGAPWYTEGMAELLGVNRWEDEKLTLNYQLKDRSEAEYWGRIQLVHKDVSDGEMQSLQDVFAIPSGAFRDVRYYAWSWAACTFLSNHPNSREAFAKLKTNAHLSPSQFNRQFISSIEKALPVLERDWQLFIDELDFNYDATAAMIRKAVHKENQDVIEIECHSSWQETGIEVRPGEKYSLVSSGRFTIANRNGTSWPCEPGGVTIEYYRGNPLGQLMVGVLGNNSDTSSLKSAYPVGLKKTIEFESSGKICFRVNESPTQMFDNKGKVQIKLSKQN